MTRRVSIWSSCNQLIDTVLAANTDSFAAARVLRTHGNEYLQAAQPDLAERCFMMALSLEADHPPEEVRRRRPAND
jgi:hypothetical protein